MIPTIALVGRPNVGKSTLFNRLTRTRDALVADQPGVTRDRHYGFATYDGQRYIVVDTGGIGQDDEDIDAQALAQPLTVAFEVIGGGLKTVIDVQRAQSIAAAATHLGSQRQQQRGVQAAGEGNPNATPWRGLRQGVFEQA
mgnify:CR=1 FL=1